MTDKTEANRQVALRVVNAVGSGDKATVASLLHPELDWWLNGIGHLDREQFLGSLDMLASAKVGGFTIMSTTAEGDRVAVEMSGRFEYEDGRVYENNYCELMTIRDGLVYRVHAFFDAIAASKAFPEVGAS
ncbi:MAG: nuclear transport factor 2 family protein [Porticoccaceae bacterium]|jgi:ketosteroid isomerase-like protein|nr:nuclear transport factor 2 family protein [Porticoccaceae bacterium]MEA3298943.1 nuclear transport factor 2 family protein [Pseudomonadota bacterium]HLS99184.1 nuclear transport factor 2 family protein [Porticoccaceae bacterium]